MSLGSPVSIVRRHSAVNAYGTAAPAVAIAPTRSWLPSATGGFENPFVSTGLGGEVAAGA